MSLKIECKQTETTPTCLLYSSSLKFLETWKNCMAATTRPTKIGKIFKFCRAKKPTLSRHIRYELCEN